MEESNRSMSRIFSSVGIHSTSKNYEVIQMFKSVFAATAALSMSAGAAFAGPYVNVESNAGWTGADYAGATTDIHLGWEGPIGESASYYIQGGVAMCPLMVAMLTLFLLVSRYLPWLLLRHWVSMVKSPSLVLVMQDMCTVDTVLNCVKYSF